MIVPLKHPSCLGVPGSHLMKFPWVHMSLRPEWHLEWFNNFHRVQLWHTNETSLQTDTDHSPPSVAISPI